MTEKTNVSLAYGTEKRDVNIDSSMLAAPPVTPRTSADAVPDPRAALAAAMEKPDGCFRLRDMVAGKRIALVVNDEFRAGLHEQILDVMFEEIAAGKPAKMTVLCATGTHDPGIYSPNVLTWTRNASKKHGLDFEFVGHDCDDPRLVEVGATSRGNRILVEPSWLEADVRVFGHEGKHHYMAGYSWVAKQVLPGISDRVSVEFNHKLALDDDSCAGQHPLHSNPARRTNPFSEDALEALRLAASRSLDDDGTVVDRPAQMFLLEVISDGSHVFWVQAGEPEAVTREMMDVADGQAEFEVPKSRYVIVSPGGPPASTSIYGVQNCFDIALLGAIEHGGEALVLGPCNGRPGVPPEVCGLAPDMKSKKLFWDNLVKLRDASLETCREEISHGFELYLWKTWRVLRLFKRDGIKIWMHSELSRERLAEAGFENAPDPQAWIDERVKRNDGKFIIINGGNKLLVRPSGQ